MKVKMKLTRPGSPDGVTVKTYRAGELYEFTSLGGMSLAGTFVHEGWAELVAEGDPRPEAKDLGAAEENKDAGPAPRNKSRRRGPARASPEAAPRRAPRPAKGGRKRGR